MSSDDDSSEDSLKKKIPSIDGFYWRRNEVFNAPVPPSVADMFLKDRYSDPQSRHCVSFILESLRCRCGYSPFVGTSKTLNPGMPYYTCGALHNRCNFYVWHKDLLNDRFRVCKCGLPVVTRQLTREDPTYYYGCIALMFKDGCDYCVEVTRFNERKSI